MDYIRLRDTYESILELLLGEGEKQWALYWGQKLQEQGLSSFLPRRWQYIQGNKSETEKIPSDTWVPHQLKRNRCVTTKLQKKKVLTIF